MTKRQIIIVSVTAVVVILFIGSALSPKKMGGGKSASATKLTEKYVQCKNNLLDDFQINISGYGRLTTGQSIDISPEVAGKLEAGSISLKNGAAFSKGQVLFKIDHRQYALALNARKSSFISAMANVLPDLKVDFPDTFENWERFFNALNVHDDLPALPSNISKKETVFLSVQNILTEYYNIQSDEIQLDKYTIKAPFSGYINTVFTEVGSSVSAATKIATINKNNNLEISIPVKNNQVDLIKVGQKAELKHTETGKTWEARVLRIAGNINPNSQSVDVFLEALNKSDLKNGMYLTANIHCGEMTGVSKLHRKALVNQKTVWTVKDSTLIATPIEITHSEGDYVFVTGLQVNETVVTDPFIGARENSRVIPLLN